MSQSIIDSLTVAQKHSIKVDGSLMLAKTMECCGFVMETGKVFHAANIAKSKKLDPSLHFVICPKVYAKKAAKVKYIYHSHINGNPNFTPADVELCRETCKPLILYDTVQNKLKAIDPSGNAPLLGREFVYGIYDCYSLVKDYYYQTDGITIDDYPRSQLDRDGQPEWLGADWNLFADEFSNQGFYPVGLGEIQMGDVLMMSFGGSGKLNHAAIYQGDGMFIHQLLNKTSCVEVWGEPWVGYTVKILRHKLWSLST